MHVQSNRRWLHGKRLRIATAGVLTLALAGGALLAALRVYVVVLRNRAETLKNQILALTPGKATLQDVHSFVRQYARPTDYVDRCDASECHVSTGICAFYFAGFNNCELDNGLLRLLGIRPARYVVGIDVVNGVVTRVAFHVSYRTTQGPWLSATTVVLDDFSRVDRCSNPGLSRHPDYAVDSGTFEADAGGHFLQAGITPHASAEERRRAQTLNLACVTALRDCGEPSDLMPLAHRDWMADSEWQQSKHADPAQEAACEAARSSSLRQVPWWATGWRIKPI